VIVSHVMKGKVRGTNLDEVDFGKGLQAARLLDVEDRNDVLVVKVSEQLHLAKSS
jgi:hypothetical protein